MKILIVYAKNGNDDNDLKVYASMARMSNDDKRENKDYGNS